MTRHVTALFLLGRLAMLAQPSPNAQSFSQADMTRLINDAAKVFARNNISATQILAKQFAEETQKAAKAPVAQRAAAMQKAADDHKKRVDAFNQGGDPGRDFGSAEAIIRNPMMPQYGFYKNLLNACLNANKFLTRTEDGMPVLQQVTLEGGTTILHTFPLGLPIEKTSLSRDSAETLCPTLVQNAIKPTPKTIALAASPSAIPDAMQLCVAVCASLQWDGKQFVVFAQDGAPAITYSVESFTAGSVILHRTELKNSPAYGLTAVYTGSLDAGGTGARGSVDFTWPGHQGFPHSGKWQATWGDQLAGNHPPLQGKKPEERGDERQAGISPQQRRLRDNVAALLVLGLLAGALEGGGDTGSGSHSGACTAGYWQFSGDQPNGGMGQQWVCTEHGK